MLKAIGIFLTTLLAAGPAHEPVDTSVRPMLVELYTSQGCPLCPAANEYLARLDQRDDVIALSFSVDYWDVYGWQDTYARPEFVERQRAYKYALELSRIYTPQFVIDGANEVSGTQRDRILDSIQTRQMMLSETVDIAVTPNGGGNFSIDVWGNISREQTASVYLAAFHPGARSVSVEGGRNEGRDVTVYNPVIALFDLGDWQSGEASFGAALPEGSAGVLIIQAGEAGEIIAVQDFYAETN